MITLLLYIPIVFLINGYLCGKSSAEKNLVFYGWEPRPYWFELNTTAIHYQNVDEKSPSNCVVRCSRRQDCGHAVFCMKTVTCYLDYSRMNYCAGDFDRCSCFAKWRNVALNAYCVASSELSTNQTCEKALDGKNAGAWKSHREGIGAWIKIYLNQPRVLLGARVMQLPRTSQRNKDIRFQFSDGSDQEFQLPYHDQERFVWDDLDLAEVTTSWVNITVLSVYTSGSNGFREIELYSTP